MRALQCTDEFGGLFESFFGGGTTNPRQRSTAARGQDLQATVDLTFEEAVFGVEKEVEFECAAPGMLGLETALPLILDFVRMGTLDEKRAIAALTGHATRAFGLPGGTLAIGSVADICVIDPERPFTISAEGLSSKSKNSPFIGQQLAGRAVLTLLEGRPVYDLDQRFERTK